MQVSADHLLAQARERFAVQDYYGAAHLLEEVLESGRSFADVHHLLGLSLAMLGHTERALTQFESALALNPRYIEANIHRGILLNELGRGAEAEAAFQAAVAHGEDRIEGYSRPVAAKLANLHAQVGEAYAETGALAEAIEQFRRAVTLGPAFHDLRYRLARLLLEAGRPLEAREELEGILAKHPDFLDAAASLGLAHYLAGDAASARELWARCRHQRAPDARVAAYLAMAQRLPA
ncbi:MAG TPA: tetratricopeptide repeat protein [Gemmatimonadales bacterium]|jgi:tetratricopeptide (TPR) repeat protein|nr:tetratricopeptide repeat protein [Gemmatimonadales bacterium]